MPTVLAYQTPTEYRNLTSAEEFGDVVFAIEDPQFQSSLFPDLAREILAATLATCEFDPAEDYVLFLGGDPAGGLILGEILAETFPDQRINFLRWERRRDASGGRSARRGYYVSVEI